jgi:hypothetical protein
VCEEFGCLPSDAARELESEPFGLTDTIMVLRSYANLKDLVEQRMAGKGGEVPDVPMVTIVMKNIERRVFERVTEKK